jgi:esterase/lipase
MKCMHYDIKQIKIVNSKGLKLAAEIYKPTISGKLPCIFLFHGFTGYKEENNLVDLADQLSRMGFVTIRFTTSGFGDSEGSLDHDYLFSNYRQDAESVFAYISRLKYVDHTKIGVIGHSMGGKLAVLFCANHPEIHTLCIVSAPVTFFSVSLGTTKDIWHARGYYEKISGRDGKRIRIPYAYADDADKDIHNVLEAATKIRNTRALVLAGKADTTVRWEDTKKIYDALNSPKEFNVYESVDHDYKRNNKGMAEVHTPIVDFFRKYL